ncbi:3-hydroxyacyl-CoA dehydrogenase family protein [Actinophytocola sediminis]
MTTQISTVGVVGVGSVGGELTRLLAASGVQVTAVDVDPAARQRLAGTVTPTDDLSALSDLDIVIEAVPEHYEQKAAVLRGIAEHVRPAAVLVTTTSELSVLALAAASGVPSRVVGLTFQVPPSAGTSVDVVATTMCDEDAVAAVRALFEQLPVTIGPLADGRRDLAAQLVLGYLNDAVDMVAAGYATVEDVDLAMRLGCGYPAGPFALIDHMGLDAVHRALTLLHNKTGVLNHRPADLLTSMVADGRLGRKAGRGFHTYDGARKPATQDAASVPARPVGTLGVVGSGTMAAGIAQAAVAAGLDTVLVARSDAKAEAAARRIRQGLDKAVQRGRTTAEAMASALARLTLAADESALADRDVVIEAIAEDAGAKTALFSRLDRVCRPGAVLATVTSSLSVTECASATGRAADVIGLHFFNPAPAMKLVEIGATAFTAPDVVATAKELVARLGKTAVVCPDRAGFIVNRLLFPYLNNAIRLVDSGVVDASALDAAIVAGFGFPMGPFTLLDWVGLDVAEAIQARLHDDGGQPELKPATLLSRLVELGALGRKTGLGFHRH